MIRVRRGTAAKWTSLNPTLRDGELGKETDTGYLKLGDGVTAWTTLAYLYQGVVAAQVGDPGAPGALINGYSAWSMDATAAGGTSVLTSGLFTAVLMQASESRSVSNLYCITTAAASTPTAGGCTVGLFSATGTLLASSADIGSVWSAAAGLKTFALSSSAAIVAGSYYYAGFLFNGTTGPTVARASGTTAAATTTGPRRTGNGSRFGGLSSQSTFPASITPSALGTGTPAMWAAAA